MNYRKRWIGYAAAAGLSVVLCAALVVPHFVARAVVRSATDRGWQADVGAVRLGARGIWLKNVRVRRSLPAMGQSPTAPSSQDGSPSLGVGSASPSPLPPPGLRRPEIAALVQSALVPWSAVGGRRAVEIHGVQIQILGNVDELKQMADTAPATSKHGNGGATQTDVSVDGVDLTWRLNSDGEPPLVAAWGLAFERQNAGGAARADRVRILHESLGCETTGLSARFVPVASTVPPSGSPRPGATQPSSSSNERRPQRISVLVGHADFWTLEDATRTEDGATPTGTGRPAWEQPARDPSQRAPALAGGRGPRSAAEQPEVAATPLVAGAIGTATPRWWSALEALLGRSQLPTWTDPEALSARLQPLAPGSTVEIREAHVRIRSSAAQKLDLGPWRVEASRTDQSVAVRVGSVPSDKAGHAELSLPLAPEAGRAQLLLNLEPTLLRDLGVREGDLGLKGVDRAQLGLSATLRAVPERFCIEWQVGATVQRLSIAQSWLSRELVQNIGFRGTAAGDLDIARSRLAVREATLNVGGVTVHLEGQVGRTSTATNLDATLTVPLAACQDVLDAVPSGLAPLLAGMKADGTLSVAGHVYFDSAELSKTAVALRMDNRCKLVSVPSNVSTSRWQRPFTLEVEDVDGNPTQSAFGPGTWTWVTAAEMSPLLGAAIQVCEDGRFLHHRGIDIEAIRSSIRDNLNRGRFARGGSTITMQLAKNLYLRRDKTLARKLQEAWLTILLEQSLNKAQILELYFNVVEFGKGLYGIGPAASHYFDTTPLKLTPAQAFFLASILPNPKASHFAANGLVTSGWTKHIHQLLAIAHQRKLITDDELASGQSEILEFRKNGNAPSASDEADASVDDDRAYDEGVSGFGTDSRRSGEDNTEVAPQGARARLGESGSRRTPSASHDVSAAPRRNVSALPRNPNEEHRPPPRIGD